MWPWFVWASNCIQSRALTPPSLSTGHQHSPIEAKIGLQWWSIHSPHTPQLTPPLLTLSSPTPHFGSNHITPPSFDPKLISLSTHNLPQFPYFYTIHSLQGQTHSYLGYLLLEIQTGMIHRVHWVRWQITPKWPNPSFNADNTCQTHVPPPYSPFKSNRHPRSNTLEVLGRKFQSVCWSFHFQRKLKPWTKEKFEKIPLIQISHWFHLVHLTYQQCQHPGPSETGWQARRHSGMVHQTIEKQPLVI